MAWRKIILHKTWWKSVEIMRMRWLIELRRVLLVWRKWPPKMWRMLHAKMWVPLSAAAAAAATTTTPRWLFMLVTPRSIKLVIPRRVSLIVPCWLRFIIPVWISVTPHAFVAIIPWRAMRGALMMRKRGLITGLLLSPRRHRLRLVKPRWFIRRHCFMRCGTSSSCVSRIWYAPRRRLKFSSCRDS